MKTFINIPLLIEQVKRFWAIPVITFIGYLLFVVVFISSDNIDGWSAANHSIAMVLTGNHAFIIFASVFVPLCLAGALFPQHFNSVAATSIAAFPVNKRQLFFTNITAGFVMYAVPLLLLSLILLIPIYTQGYVNVAPPEYSALTASEMLLLEQRRITQVFIQHWSNHLWGASAAPGTLLNSFPVVMGFLGRTLLTFSFYFALTIMVVAVTGNRFVSMLLAGFVAFLPTAIIGLGWAIADVYVFGYAINNTNMINYALYFMHPVVLGTVLSGRTWLSGLADINPWTLYIIYFVVMAAMLGLGAFACLRRKTERAGESVAFVPLKNILVFLLSLGGMIVGGMFFMMLFSARWGYYFGFVIGFILLFFIAQMIAEKTFHVIGKVKRLPYFGATAVGLYVLVLLVTRVGMMGYINHIPAANNIAGVRIYHNHWWWGDDQPPFIREEAIINQVRDVHQEILNNQSALRGYQWRSYYQSWPRLVIMRQVPITYLLNNGAVVTRMYRIPQHLFEEMGLYALLQTDEVVLSNYPQLHDPARLHSIEVRLPGTRYTIESLEWLINELEQSDVMPVLHEGFPYQPHDLPWLREHLQTQRYFEAFLHSQGFTEELPRSITITNPPHIAGLAEALRADVVATNQAHRARQAGVVQPPYTRTFTLTAITNMPPSSDGRTTWWRSNHVHLTEFDNTLAWIRNNAG